MRFFFPDSQDQIDPFFDFATEEHSPFRVRQRDDLYAHEVLTSVPFDGMLVSKAIVDGTQEGAGRYSAPQRARFYREGVRRFFRLDGVLNRTLLTMGDCGAFAYVKEEEPPYTVDQVINFYEDGGFDLGISMDHIVLGYVSEAKAALPGMTAAPEDWERRRLLTLDLAADFLGRHEARGCDFEPVGAVQGWSPSTYADSVRRLQEVGYRRIALGGMVALKTPEILAVLESVAGVLATGTELHLLGVTRVDHIPQFAEYGVTSFDSTSPFRQSFKDETDNYYLLEGSLTALRVPQAGGNTKLKARIQAGELDPRRIQDLERRCMNLLRMYGAKRSPIGPVVDALREYEAIWDGRKDRSAAYAKTLKARPWTGCDCGICEAAGIDVAIFRGSERNKRRGFHNVHVFRRRLDRAGVTSPSTEALSVAG